MKIIIIHNEHVVIWCLHHVAENLKTETFYKNGSIPGIVLDDYLQQVFPGTGTSQQYADYFGWLAFMASLALEAEKKAQDLVEYNYCTQAITAPWETQKKRLGIE